jgi:hypothetical protein
MARDLPTTGSFSDDPKVLRRQAQELEQRLRTTLRKLDSATTALETLTARHTSQIAALEERVTALEP